MTWGDYMRVCFGEIKREQNFTRQTRLILGALLHKDPREIIPMKGDYDHLVPKTKEEIRQLLMKWNKTEWLS
jgi:hypothetical protein